MGQTTSLEHTHWLKHFIWEFWPKSTCLGLIFQNYLKITLAKFQTLLKHFPVKRFQEYYLSQNSQSPKFKRICEPSTEFQKNWWTLKELKSENLGLLTQVNMPWVKNSQLMWRFNCQNSQTPKTPCNQNVPNLLLGSKFQNKIGRWKL